MKSASHWIMDNPTDEPDHSFGGVEYEDRVVVFVDLLGWRNLVEETKARKTAVSHLGFVLGLFGKTQASEFEVPAGFPGHVPSTFQATHFSDTVVMSWQYREEVGAVVAASVGQLYSSVVNYGLLLRGSIVRGPLFHRAGMIFGPALADAYDIERTGAIYPRIVVSTDLASDFGRGRKILDAGGEVSARSKSWRRDRDGKTFYDFAQPFGAMEGLLPTAPKWSNSIDLFSKYLSWISNGLHRFSEKPRELRKYLWLAYYYNDVISEYPEKGAVPVDLSVWPDPYNEALWH